jgi:hypothetical protein
MHGAPPDLMDLRDRARLGDGGAESKENGVSPLMRPLRETLLRRQPQLHQRNRPGNRLVAVE